MSKEFHLGPWLVQPTLHRLCPRPGLEEESQERCRAQKQLSHKVMAVLVLLAESPGEVVTKEELINRVWEGHFTSDEALTTVVYELRKALDDDARNPQFVETIRKGGYRLIAPVSRPQADDAVSSASAAQAPRVATSQQVSSKHLFNSPPKAVVAAAALGVLLTSLGLWWLNRTSQLSQQPSAPMVEVTETFLQAPQPRRIESLAVLPMVTFNAECRQDSFAGGLTEMLIADLAATAPLEVLPSISTRVEGTRMSLEEVASKLNADAVVEGTIVRSGEQIWLSVQLVDTENGRMLWGGTFERQADNSMALQRDLAWQIAQEVRRSLQPPSPIPGELSIELSTRGQNNKPPQTD